MRECQTELLFPGTWSSFSQLWASLVAQTIKNLPANAGDAGSIPGPGRSPGGGHGNPLQYSCLGNPMERGAWQGTVHGVTKSWTQLTPSLSLTSRISPSQLGSTVLAVAPVWVTTNPASSRLLRSASCLALGLVPDKPPASSREPKAIV